MSPNLTRKRAGRAGPEPVPRAANLSPGPLKEAISLRSFLKLLAAVAAAGVARLAGGHGVAEAGYTPEVGGAPDQVDCDLRVLGNLDISGNMGIGTSTPQGRLDVAGEICINGAQVIGTDGVIK